MSFWHGGSSFSLNCALPVHQIGGTLPCALAVATLRNAPSLSAGTKYWITATTTAAQAGLDARWYGSNSAQFAYNLGTGWVQFGGGTPAFMVQGQGTAVPYAPYLAPDTLHAAFGGNLFVDPCTGCTYDPNSGGLDVRGPDNCTSPGSTTWLAVPFIASATGVPRRISASINLHNPTFCPQNKVTLSLYTDNCGAGPGTPLISGQATVPAAPCALAVAKLRNAPSLTAGTKYWVVATKVPPIWWTGRAQLREKELPPCQKLIRPIRATSGRKPSTFL